MANEARSIEPERIVFEPTGKDRLWRMRVEGGDVEAHSVSWDRFSAAPAGQDQESGEALFEVSFGGEDVEGHGSRWGDVPAIPPARKEGTQATES